MQVCVSLRASLLVIKVTVFKEEAKSALAVSMRVLYPSPSVEGGKPENPEKNPRSKARANNKLNPQMAPGRNGPRATLVGGERPHQCAIPAPSERVKNVAQPKTGSSRALFLSQF